jgi:RNA polymerase sigma-70 factor (ECF subfamily)
MDSIEYAPAHGVAAAENAGGSGCTAGPDRYVRIIPLIEQHRGALLKHVKRILGCSEDAEDVVQDTCVRLMRARDFWRGEHQVRGFLFKIATNLARDELRRRRSSSASSHFPHDSVELPGDGPQPDELVERHSTVQAIAHALSTLPPRYREVFNLHIECDLSYRAISKRLGISTKTVERDMSGAREYCLDRLAFMADRRGPRRLSRDTATAVA